MPPIMVATWWPTGNSPPGHWATTPAASMPRTRSNVTRCEALAGMQLGPVQPERLDLDQHPTSRRRRNWELADRQRIGRARPVEDDRSHGVGHPSLLSALSDRCPPARAREGTAKCWVSRDYDGTGHWPSTPEKFSVYS